MMSVPSDVDRFASTVRQRSAEHAVAMPHMGITGITVTLHSFPVTFKGAWR